MGYHLVDPEGLDPLPDRHCTAYAISGADTDSSNLKTLGIRVYVVEPGGQIPKQYHYHDIQEEAFYVISGTLYVETPEETYEVESGQVLLVEAGSPHRAFNPEDATTAPRVLAMGAPSSDGGKPFAPNE